MLLAWTNTDALFSIPGCKGSHPAWEQKNLKLWAGSSRVRYHLLSSLSAYNFSRGTQMNSSKWKASEGLVTLPQAGEGPRVMQDRCPCGRSEHSWMFWTVLPLAQRWGWHSWWLPLPISLHIAILMKDSDSSEILQKQSHLEFTSHFSPPTHFPGRKHDIIMNIEWT